MAARELIEKFQKVNGRKLLIACVILFCVYCASMLGATKAYLFGASSYSEYNFAVSAPFFGGFVLIGFFGLLQIIRNVGSKECLYGFLVVGFCYVGIEILFQATGG